MFSFTYKKPVVWYIWRLEWFVMAFVALIDTDSDPSVKQSLAVLFDHSLRQQSQFLTRLIISYNNSTTPHQMLLPCQKIQNILRLA